VSSSNQLVLVATNAPVYFDFDHVHEHRGLGGRGHDEPRRCVHHLARAVHHGMGHGPRAFEHAPNAAAYLSGSLGGRRKKI
jgi:hypothetical protein